MASIIALAVAGARVLFVLRQNESGFCWRSGAVLSDAELLQAFGQSFYPELISDLSSGVRNDDDHMFGFSSGEEYMAAVVDCCQVLTTRAQRAAYEGQWSARLPEQKQMPWGQAYTMIAAKKAAWAAKMPNPTKDERVVVEARTNDGKPIFHMVWIDACGGAVRIPERFFLG